MGKLSRGRTRRGGPARIETSAGGVIVRWQNRTPHILLIRDSYDHWGFPKGHVEKGETPDVAALREVEEETGLSQLVLGPQLQTIDWFFRARGRLIHKYCHFYLIESADGDPCPQEDEGITECRWMPLTEALQTISYANAREVLKRAAEELEGEPGRSLVSPARRTP